jgi:hypothetical protein
MAQLQLPPHSQPAAATLYLTRVRRTYALWRGCSSLHSVRQRLPPPRTRAALLAPRPHLHQELHDARLRVRAGGVVRPLPGAAAALGHAHHHVLPSRQPQQLLLVRQPEAARGAAQLAALPPIKSGVASTLPLDLRALLTHMHCHSASHRYATSVIAGGGARLLGRRKA